MRKTPSKQRRWVQTVTTISTAPPRGTFTRPAHKIADIMARPEVSPRGLGSGIRMIQYFINRGGRNLTTHRRQQLERAKRILQRRLARESHGARTARRRL
jgi:tRNA(adenine34) deaminase